MKCWNCGLDTMKPYDKLGKGWFKCSDCGAPWREVSKPLQAVAEETVTYPDGSKGKHFKAKLTGRKAKK